MASIEDALSQYNQSNFDVGATASLIRQLAQKSGLTEDQLAAAVPVFGDEHRALLNSGYTEGSNYAAIAQRAVADALKARGADPTQFTQATQGLVSQGAGQAQQRWQATQEDDGFGLGTILSVAAIVASFVAPEIAPFLKAGGAAVSFAETGNPLGAIISYAAPAAFGGADFASGNIDVNGQALGDGASSFGNIDVNGQALGDGGLINGGGVTYAAEQGTFDPNAAPELTTTDNPYPDTEVTPTSAPAGETGTFDPNAQGDVPAQAAPVDTSASLQNADGTWGSTAANSVAGGSGTVDPASSWLDNLKNLDPKLQAALAVAGGGLLSGALSGIGNYAATQSKIAADSALADKVSQNRIAEQAAIRNNNKVPGLLNLRPNAANAILRRADGTPYYKQG